MTRYRPTRAPIRVLFVCTAQLGARSIMAEALLRKHGRRATSKCFSAGHRGRAASTR